MERETGIEPAPSAWKAEVLPLNYSRADAVPAFAVACGWVTLRPSRAWRDLVEGGGLLRASCPPPSGPRRKRRVQDRSRRSCRTTAVVLIHLHGLMFVTSTPSQSPLRGDQAGGGRWIRTTEGVSQQIYSLPPLAAWVSLQQRTPIVGGTCGSVNKIGSFRPRACTDGGGLTCGGRRNCHPDPAQQRSMHGPCRFSHGCQSWNC